MADELVKLILETSGQQGVQQLGQDVDKLSKELKDLVIQWQQGTLATDEFIKKTSQTSGQLKQTQELVNSLTGKAGSGRNAGQGLLTRAMPSRILRRSSARGALWALSERSRTISHRS